ncbi:MAG: PrsW family intramembrane metalloprotease [Phycisphaeraceae bacterium]|nr:PrsW family intramembrane metalloprotease [Phycisphaeraceae bacterium]
MPVGIVLLLSALVVLALILRYDMFERERAWAVALALLLGAGLMAVAGWTSGRQIALIGHPSVLNIASAAAIHEEAAKMLVVLVMVVLLGQGDDPMDGLIYGSLGGLGAAIEESLTIWHTTGFSSIGAGQEPVRLLGHAVMGGLGGFGIGALLRRRWALAGAGVGLAVLLHFAWDMHALGAPDAGRPQLASAARAIAIMITGLGLYAAAVVVAARWSRDRFAPGSPIPLLTRWRRKPRPRT